jgi:hypothetical protein
MWGKLLMPEATTQLAKRQGDVLPSYSYAFSNRRPTSSRPSPIICPDSASQAVAMSANHKFGPQLDHQTNWTRDITEASIQHSLDLSHKTGQWYLKCRQIALSVSSRTQWNCPGYIHVLLARIHFRAAGFVSLIWVSESGFPRRPKPTILPELVLLLLKFVPI